MPTGGVVNTDAGIANFDSKSIDMITGLEHLHSFLRWVILLLLLISVTKAMFGSTGRFFEKDRKAALLS